MYDLIRQNVNCKAKSTTFTSTIIEKLQRKLFDNSFNGQYGVYTFFVTIFQLQKR